MERQTPSRPILLATRGSALALAQTNQVMALCRRLYPELEFLIQIIKTTGDKLQAAALANPDGAATKGLFTKELEVALLDHEADLAIHSLKDLPTELPAGLELGAVCERADVRDVMIYRQNGAKKGFYQGLRIENLPAQATIATSSTRRQAQLLALRPDLKVVPIRGNVGTRLQKLWDQPGLDALILAAAGLARLHFQIDSDGKLTLPPSPAPAGLTGKFWATRLPTEVMLPCVGQGAIGIETRCDDAFIATLCQRLNHPITHQCVTAERAFLRAMGGGCQSPVAAYASVVEGRLFLRAISFRQGPAQRAEISGTPAAADSLGTEIARLLLSKEQRTDISTGLV
jgi:hydroxymethylbilane synthase